MNKKCKRRDPTVCTQIVPRRPLLTTCHSCHGTRVKSNFIYTHKNVGIPCIAFHENRKESFRLDSSKRSQMPNGIASIFLYRFSLKCVKKREKRWRKHDGHKRFSWNSRLLENTLWKPPIPSLIKRQITVWFLILHRKQKDGRTDGYGRHTLFVSASERTSNEIYVHATC
jgi:hypothetical protein